MKKTYFSPVIRYVDLSHEDDILNISQMPKVDPDDNPGEEVTDPDEVLTRGGGIWTWSDY